MARLEDDFWDKAPGDEAFPDAAAGKEPVTVDDAKDGQNDASADGVADETGTKAADDKSADTEAAGDQLEAGDDQPVQGGVLRDLLRERDKRQAAQTEAREAREKAETLQRQLDEVTARQTPPRQTPSRPDPVIDPDGAANFDRLESRIRFEGFSKYTAAGTHGEDVVNAAETAINAAMLNDPTLRGQVQNHPHPYDFAVKWHKQQQAQQEIGAFTSLEDLFAAKAADLGYARVGGDQSRPAVHDPRKTQQRPAASLANVAASVQTGGPKDPDPFERKLFGPK